MKNKIFKILFVDDTLSMHTLVRTYLEKAGYECTCASNGEEGLKLVPIIKPDLILLDYMMPGLDGGQVHAELINNPLYRDYKDIPVIILSAKEFNQEIKTRFLEGGISAYLLKPFGMRELTNIIENVFIISDIKRKNIQLQHEIQQTRDYLELLFDTIPMGILTSDRQGHIKKVNTHFLYMLDLDRTKSIVGQNFLGNKYLANPELQNLFKETLINGNAATLECLTLETSGNKPLSLKLKTTPIHVGDDIAGEIIIAQDITEVERRQHELAMLGQISHFMNRAIQLDQLLHLVLTALTAGCAFGFSRAMILLINKKSGLLEGRMGVGPSNQEEANRIWTELSKEEISLPNFLEKYGLKQSNADEYFNNMVKQIKMPINQTSCIFSKIIEEKSPAMIHRHSPEMSNCSDLFQKLKMEEFLAVPLIAKDNVIGVIAADNFFSNRQIDRGMLELLTLFATQAGLAVERAEAYYDLEQEKNKLEQAYRELKETQQRLLHAERLATVGKMAAQIAHEIRNPLVAIGGFARHILKLTETEQANEKLPTYAKIITEEVQRLEVIL
ncbi:response regulator, partial [candidate division KSB1 bacterium]|nr:response regulator [candidate division KSB1 bacterium]